MIGSLLSVKSTPVFYERGLIGRLHEPQILHAEALIGFVDTRRRLHRFSCASMTLSSVFTERRKWSSVIFALSPHQRIYNTSAPTLARHIFGTTEQIRQIRTLLSEIPGPEIQIRLSRQHCPYDSAN